MGFLKILRKQRAREREMRILILGLDNAGKTTLMKKFLGEPTDTIEPTLGFDIKTVHFKEYQLNLWDVGGQKSLRSYWKNYFESTDALIWVVDSSDRERLNQCSEELKKLLGEEKLAGATLLVLANKSDLTSAIDVETISEVLDLKSIKSHHWKIFSCCALSGDNRLVQSINWLCDDDPVEDFWNLLGSQNVSDSQARFEKYSAVRENVQKHNEDFEKGLTSFKMATNKFSVELDSEIAPLSLDLSTLTPTKIQNPTKNPRQKRQTANSTVDWRFAMRPVFDQAQCGGCWAFAMVAMVEGVLYLKGHNETGDLSIQQLLSCDVAFDTNFGVKNQGCHGGYLQVAADYLKAHGERSALDIPFLSTHQKSTCLTAQFAPIAPKIASFQSAFLESTNDTRILTQMANSMVEMVKNGPVAVGMAVSKDLYSYAEGVYDGACGDKINHAVVIVGFTDDYWIVRNSWGSNWGEDGYFRVKRSDNIDRCRFLRYYSQATEIGELEDFEFPSSTSTEVSSNDTCDICDVCDEEDDEDEEEDLLFTSTTSDFAKTSIFTENSDYIYDDFYYL
ncbi:unnamed protein product [Caenorhabditis angaria]|uniref:ADP-ribosylation factor-like protein 2 n=1 Tax=Caenorhabditis angaria TaxID=860376 RepID=A0A9P1MYR0_9PELO|nr:unnamed protein product [Caenorhabditis angaria]